MLSTRSIFVDTSAWVAFFNPRDSHYHDAREFWASVIRQQLRFVTSDYVLDETYTHLRRTGLAQMRQFHRLIEASHVVRVVDIDHNLRQVAWELINTYDDKLLSFTDCTSFALMRQLKLQDTFTFDTDFARVGFIKLPG